MCLCAQLEEGKSRERRKKIASDLSDLVIYCRPVPFDEESRDYTKLVEKESLVNFGWELG